VCCGDDYFSLNSLPVGACVSSCNSVVHDGQVSADRLCISLLPRGSYKAYVDMPEAGMQLTMMMIRIAVTICAQVVLLPCSQLLILTHCRTSDAWPVAATLVVRWFTPVLV